MIQMSMFLLISIAMLIGIIYMILKNKDNVAIIMGYVMGTIPFIIGVASISLFIYWNYIVVSTCDNDLNCMNESGMVVVFGAFFLITAVIIYILTFIISIIIKRKAKI